MAFIFELRVECKDEADTLRLSEYFSGLTFTLLNGRMITWDVALERSPSGNSAVLVSSPDLSSMGVRTINDAMETTEAGLRIYAHLKNAPAFRFAWVGWEAQNIALADLPDYLEPISPDSSWLNLECVLDEELYRQLGSPIGFHPFRTGYWWRRYLGESYCPLYSNDQHALNDLCRHLLPEYFDLKG